MSTEPKHYHLKDIDIFCFPHNQWKEHVRDGAWAKVSAVNKLPLTFCGADSAAAVILPRARKREKWGNVTGEMFSRLFASLVQQSKIRYSLTQRIRTTHHLLKNNETLYGKRIWLPHSPRFCLGSLAPRRREGVRLGRRGTRRRDTSAQSEPPARLPDIHIDQQQSQQPRVARSVAD